MKRQQKLKQQQEEENTTILVGQKDPEEFCDPLLGSLMKEPVLLKTSNRVCDRSVALQCILRGGRDPFNNRKLTQAMLEPLPDLARRIEEWRVRAEERKDVSVDIKETKCLIDASGFNNDLLEALLEMESIHRTMRKLKEQESNPSANADWIDNNNEAVGNPANARFGKPTRDVCRSYHYLNPHGCCA